MLTRIDIHDLSTQNTFGMKVSCACFIQYDKAEDLNELDFQALPQPVLHIGSGSNLLFTGNFAGTILHSAIKYIKYIDMGLNEVLVAVGAGVLFDDFVAQTCGHGLWGAENLSLIPGETGAAAVQNIGAYGVEVKDIISGVVCYDTQTRSKCTFKVGECNYGYRTSRFKEAPDKGRYIVTSVLFRLSRAHTPKLEYKGLKEALGGNEPKTPQEVRDAVIKIRMEKLPDPKVMGSAGSFFKNPVISREQFQEIEKIARIKNGDDYQVPHYDLGQEGIKVPAAWLIDQCGFKGMRRGNAAVHHIQPLVIVNYTGNATPDEILELEGLIVSEVYDKFGIELIPEVEHI